jgi:hypothetical protein
MHADITKVFHMPHHIGRCCINVIWWHRCVLSHSCTVVIAGHCCTSDNSCTSYDQGPTVAQQYLPTTTLRRSCTVIRGPTATQQWKPSGPTVAKNAADTETDGSIRCSLLTPKREYLKNVTVIKENWFMKRAVTLSTQRQRYKFSKIKCFMTGKKKTTLSDSPIISGLTIYNTRFCCTSHIKQISTWKVAFLHGYWIQPRHMKRSLRLSTMPCREQVEIGVTARSGHI